MKKLLITSLLLGSTTAFAAPFVVKDIRVDGLESSSANGVLKTIPVRVGQKATDADISKTVRALFLTGQYDDVRAKRDGNTLVIDVVPKALITNVEISGNKLIPTEALKQNLDANGFKAGEVLNRAKLEEFRKSLLEHYKTVGRYNAKVETNVNVQSLGGAEVVINIKEDDVALLKEVTFEGNNAFSSRKLAGQMELQEDAWWKFFGNKFEQAQFGKDLETLHDFYLNRGYAKFKIVDTDVQLNEAQTEARVKIKVDEGSLYTIKDVKVLGDLAGMSEQIKPLLKKIRVGEYFSRADMLSLEEAIKAKLGEQGYATAKVNVQPEFNEQDKTMVLNFVVEAGRVYSVRQIRFEGNTVSADKTLRQEMRQQEGAWLSSQLVELGKIRLDRTGFFETVESKIDPVPNTDLVDVIYKVKERNTGSLNFGVGYGTESGLSYQASIRQDNFLGMGSSIALGGSRSDNGTNLELRYDEPYFTKDGVSLGGKIFFDKNDSSKSRDSFGRTTYGTNVSLGFPVNENNAYSIGLGYTYNHLKNIDPEYNRWLYKTSMNYKDWNFKSNDFDLSVRWNYNSLNRGYFPTKGVRASLGGKVTLLGSSNKYYTLSSDVRGFYPIDRDHRWVLSGRLGLDYADGFSGKRLPFYQNYTAGGMGTLRGFAYGAIGPNAISPVSGGKWVKSSIVVGGNAMATTSLELIFPVPFVMDKTQNSVRTSIFVDAASVWNTRWKEQDKKAVGIPNLPDYSSPSRIRVSSGVALQWNSPIGPLVFSYAKPLKKYQGDEIEQFQFNVGGSF